MTSHVSATKAAGAAIATVHFAHKLQVETDCWDVHEALSTGTADFVLLDVRGDKAFEKAHVKGAISLAHRDISEESLKRWPKDSLFVVYCAGPHCNGADKAALKLAQLGRSVKIMIGGITGWADEGFAFEQGA